MPRPKGMQRDDHARTFFIGALLAALGICVLVIVFFGLTEVAKSQGVRCAPYDILVKRLNGPKYNEYKIASGLSGQNKTEVFANPATGSFSFVVRLPNGAGCLLGAGTNFQFHKPVRPKPDST